MTRSSKNAPASRLDPKLPEGAVPSDSGLLGPIEVKAIADALGIELEFMSYKQETEEGRAMREWIVENVRPLDRAEMLKKYREWQAQNR